jgi:hypothetical protein
MRPVQLWNEGKKEEFKHRKVFSVEGSLKHKVVKKFDPKEIA